MRGHDLGQAFLPAAAFPGGFSLAGTRLLMGAMTAFAISDRSGSPWLGVCAAAIIGALLGLLHAALTELPRVNDVAAGIALIVFGSGLAFFFGKQFVAPMAPQLPVLEFGF